ncbi:SDR family oxidoreductase [Ornithinimicrobium sediminis]|uniref:SDR family oxidoreductase n=1 Tax=Ornithinimicrobium sediminis TaxID=2904603 RepID=UPI001E373218|nr:SDR family oxidoreductase [Ornithinimicrobium sediminis]MCE0488153.1 SDR family oxidoreductase [Ornithinimicrobium sediminis]
MILVVGATGMLGGRITQGLLSRGEEVRVLVRSEAAAQQLAAAGARPVIGDLKDAESLAAACAGADTVVTTANSAMRTEPDTVDSVDRQGNAHLVAAAEQAGVDRFVYVSALGAAPGHPVPLLSAKGETEQRLRASTMTWTVLQPNAFMDVYVPMVFAAPALAGTPVTIVGEGRQQHSLVALSDVAAYALAAYDHPAAEDATLVIGGPEPVTWRDVVAALESELGRDIELRTVSPGEPVPGLPENVAQLLATFDTFDSPVDMSEMSHTYGVQPTRLQDFVAALAASTRT